MWQPVRTAKSASVFNSKGRSVSKKLKTGDTYTFSARAPEGDRDWTMHIVTDEFYNEKDELKSGVLYSRKVKVKDGQLSVCFKVKKKWDGDAVRLVFVGGRVQSEKDGTGLRALGSGDVFKVG